MKKQCRLIAMLLIVVFALCACSNNSNPAEYSTGIVVGFSQLGAESDWRRANTKSMQDAFSESSGYRLIMDDAQQKQDKQITAIRNYIQQGVDYIVLAPVTETGWDTVLQEAKTAGIPVFIVDRMIDCRDDSLYTGWVGSDFKEEGRKAIEWMETHPDKSNPQIVHLQGTIGSSAQLGRSQALYAGLNAHPEWKLVWRESGEFTQAKGEEIIRQLLKNNIVFNTIYAENDDMAYGAIHALREVGLEPGRDVRIITFDANHKALEMVMNGEIALAVECNPLHGPRVRALIEQLRLGQLPQKQTFVTEEWFDITNLSPQILDERGY